MSFIRNEILLRNSIFRKLMEGKPGLVYRESGSLDLVLERVAIF